MNTLKLGLHLGDVSGAIFQRLHNAHQAQSLEHFPGIQFGFKKPDEDEAEGHEKAIAHHAGTNCLAIDSVTGRYLVSGGADTALRVWDLETQSTNTIPEHPFTYNPVAAVSRSNQDAHSHAITSISLYPFDPVPQTLLSTSYDKSLLVSGITSTSIQPIHKFQLDFTTYTHSLSPVPSSTPLVAVGSAHPAVRLLDLRSGLSTHSLPGHNEAVYALAWHPKIAHVLLSGSADGRILTFDIRRANSVFASFDLDDSIGLIGDPPSLGNGARKTQLDFKAKAHNGAVTGLAFTAQADKLVSAGHDQRIRVWDVSSGRNDLVHFGPRIRNERLGELKPLISPAICGKTSKETLLWANDDGRGEVHEYGLREGNLISIMRVGGLDRAQIAASSGAMGKKRGGGHSQNSQSASTKVNKMTSGGRINGMAWRVNAECGEGIELYTAHGDGRICAWLPRSAAVGMIEDEEMIAQFHEDEEEKEEKKRKRKRDLIGDLVEGLSKRPVTFS